MDMKALHKRFSDENSPSVEGQIRWLQKQQFSQSQIDQAMMTLYMELDAGRVPEAWTKGGETCYCLQGTQVEPDPAWTHRPIATGHDLDQMLLTIAKYIRTQELTVMITHLEKFEASMRSRWNADLEALAKAERDAVEKAKIEAIKASLEREQEQPQKMGFFKRLTWRTHKSQ